MLKRVDTYRIPILCAVPLPKVPLVPSKAHGLALRRAQRPRHSGVRGVRRATTATPMGNARVRSSLKRMWRLRMWGLKINRIASLYTGTLRANCHQLYELGNTKTISSILSEVFKLMNEGRFKPWCPPPVVPAALPGDGHPPDAEQDA